MAHALVHVHDRRLAALTRRCAWCDRIDTGHGWARERRRVAGPTTDGICPGCFAALQRQTPRPAQRRYAARAR